MQGDNTIASLYFQGMHVLGNFTCQSCGLDYFASLDSGHATHFPVSFSKDSQHQLFDKKEAGWLAKPLIDSIGNRAVEGSLQVLNRSSGEELILINCLDSCFGHVFTKVWNVYVEINRDQNKTIAVLIPEQCRWLLPKEGLEIWSVDVPLSQIHLGINGLDKWMKSQFQRFRKVLLHPVFIHLDHRQMDFEKILGEKPFDLEYFYDSSIKITFVWREDRFWLANRFLHWLYMVSRKFKLEKFFKPLFLWRQKKLIHRLAKIINRSFSEVCFTVTGLGKSSVFPAGIKDERVTTINFEVEKRWNNIFSKSHVVLGVHGSHMLIPSALAAGFVEILPRYKINHLAEDICRTHSGRLGQFLGRIIDENAGPKLVALHITSMIQRFNFVKSNLESKLV